MTKLTLVPANEMAPSASTSYEVVDQLSVVVGRESGCDVLIDEALDMVSRRHMTVRLDGDELVAEDTSSNGIFINGTRVAGLRVLQDEDVLQLGPNGPMLAVALDPKPPKKPPQAKATRMYTPKVEASLGTRPQPLAPVEPVGRGAALAVPAVPSNSSQPEQGAGARSDASSPLLVDSSSAYVDKAQDTVLQAHGWLTQVFTHPVVFVGVYLFFMLLTYYLPYLGSNSAVSGAAHLATGVTNGPFWAHFFSLGVLVGATWYRGSVIGKPWIMIFPIIAAIFDLAPLLNWIPLIPTFMHIAALIMGVRGRTTG